ncbi:hypothetical protein ScPMuIL_004490 [Solemya velum]
MVRCSTQLLTTVSLGSGAVAIVTLALAVGTDSWLYTHDTADAWDGNKTIAIATDVRQGLWRVCTIPAFPGISPQCIAVESFETKEGRVDGQEVTMAIMRANRISSPFPVVSLMIMVIAAIFNVLGNFKKDYKIVVSAVAYIVSGLLLAVGIILYISAINDETGHKSKSKNADTYVFRYQYGWSFYFAGLGFLTAEITAVVCISLYLKRNSEVASMVRIIPGLDQKIREGAKENTEGICNPTVIL